MEWIVGIFVLFLVIGWLRGRARRRNLVRDATISGVAGYAIGRKLGKM